MLKVVNYIKEHGLAKTLDTFSLKCKVYENKILLKYSQIESPMGEAIVQECRGIILEKDTLKVMCLGLTKFFNSAEGHAATIDNNTARILKKEDGTCINLYWDFHKEIWIAATTGMAEGEGEVNNKLGTTFNELFWQTINGKYSDFDINFLDKDFTYVFELTTPYNIVVKPHGVSSVTLLTVRNTSNLKEFSYDGVGTIARMLGLPHVESYNIDSSIETLMKTFIDMPWDEEGYVIVDDNHNRIKVKNPAYVAVHHLKSKTSEHAIMGVVKTNEIDEFVATFPERAEEITKLKTNYNILLDKLETACETLKPFVPTEDTREENKDYAMKVFELAQDDLKQFTGLFFSLKHEDFTTVREHMLNYDNKVLYKML
tara:strand:+ start:136989 stop:138104 length:1116 start_codon:yes stop_codon:yes gene_type:complete